MYWMKELSAPFLPEPFPLYGPSTNFRFREEKGKRLAKKGTLSL